MRFRSKLKRLISRRLTPEDVTNAYQLLFRREPEDRQIVDMHVRSHQNIWSLLGVLLESKEFAKKHGEGIRATFDWAETLQRYAQPLRPYRQGYITSFLGTQTNVTFLPNWRESRGFVESLPIRGGFHCSASEWIAGLRGVDLCSRQFTVVELGAGWGPWMVDLATAARIKGVERTYSVGCEADELHCRFTTEHLACNGFQPGEYKLYEGIIGTHGGVALFPLSDDSSSDWGLRPVFCATQQEADRIMANPESYADYRGHRFRGFRRARCYTLQEVYSGLDLVDVLHVDVQGSELELLRANVELLSRTTRYLVVGTHARHIESGLLSLLHAAGWKLEVEEPCRFDVRHPTLAVQIDGTQGWLNPSLQTAKAAA